MKITKIEIQNFKAFKECQQFDIEGGKNVLAFGTNGSGKSSFYYALHAFLQSSGKTTEQRKKYFLFEGKESLLNIYAPQNFPSFIKITTDSGNTYEFSPTLTTGNIDTSTDVVKLANEASDFMNYRFMQAFSNFRNSQDANIFPILQNEFFPFWEITSGKTFQDWYDELLAEPPKLKALYEGSTKGKKISFWGTNGPHGKYKVKLEEFNKALKEKFLTYIETMNDLMQNHFLKNDNIKLFFDDSSFKPLKIEDNTWSGCWRIVEPELTFKITKDGKPIPKPHVFLNEARLTGIALSMRLAVFEQRYKGTCDFKLLVMDDLLLSLDMSKRMEIVNYILANEDFNKYQLFILTHDKGFYTILQNNLIKNEDHWKSFEFYENANNPTEYKNPIVIESIDALKKAEQLLKGDLTATPPIPPKYEECALYLRKKAEQLIRIFYDSSLENLSRYEVLDTLSNSLKGIEKEYYGKTRMALTSLFEDDKLLTEENVNRLKADPYINGSISRNDVLSANNLKHKILTILEEFAKHKAKINSIRNDLLEKCKGADELRSRILNHGAHPTTEPLFGAEVAAGVDTIEKFANELKTTIEWFKEFEKEVLKLKQKNG